MARFGGWQAQYLASVIMMTGEGRGISDGMAYTRESDTILTYPGKTRYGSGQRWSVGMSATIYVIGVVDIDEAWLNAILPDPIQREHFMRGRQSEFDAASEN